MRNRLEQVANRINALSPRERGLLMLTALVVLIGLWEVLLFAPLQERQAALQAQIGTLHASIATLNGTITEAANKQSGDPNAQLRHQLNDVQKRNRRLDGRLKAATAGLVAPRQMATVLERVLKSRHGLTLIQAANLPAKAMLLGDDDDPDSAEVFQHGLTLTFEGSFLDTLDYLKTLSGLPWHFYWDSLDLKVKDYPVSRITLKVHTLNLKKGWIGV